MPPDLLPPNATALERGLSLAIARDGAIGFDLGALWDPWTCPADLLPWLAWGLSIDRWDPSWIDDQKRAATATAIAEQRHKGTPWAVEQVLQRFDQLLELVEWFDASPRLDPYTFEVRLPLVDADGVAGGRRVSAEFTRAIITEVSRAKPVRAHFTLVQSLELTGVILPFAAVQATHYRRLDVSTVNAGDTTPWANLLQTENGEPLFDDVEAIEDTPA